MRLDFSNKETVLVRVILVLALIFAAISFVQNSGLTGLVPSENRTNSLPVWTGNDSWQTGKNSAFAVDLNNFFSDADNDVLAYLATAADKIDVSVQDNLLTVTPALDFVGERTIAILASDGFDAVRVNVRIIVGTDEERALSPIEENISTEEILNESIDANISSNTSQPEVLNTTVSSENVSLETEENVAIQTFDVNEKIKDENNKDVGKKLVDETAFETFFTAIEKNESGMQVVFYHNATAQQPVWIEGNVNYTLSADTAEPFENITLFVPRIEGIIPKFKLHIGISSDVFEFGKVIPDIVFEGNSTLIDRDDEKIDVLLSKGDASASIRGAYDISAITAKVSPAEESILKTDVFAAESMPIDNATISLLKKGRVTSIMECSEFNVLTDSCAGEWIKTGIPFEQNETHITFTVTHFSGYAGADINVINVQSYPMVGGNWIVEFNTTGTTNLTITAFNGTTWTDYADSGYDLKFLELKCGNTLVNYTWANNSVFVQDYNCSSSSFETSKVLTEGRHYLIFQFGNDTAYAYNDAFFLRNWTSLLNFSDVDYGRTIAVDANDNIIVVGTNASWGGINADGLIIKLNGSNGVQLWNYTIDGNNFTYLMSVDTDLANSIYVFGYNGTSNTTDDDYVLFKRDIMGNPLWSRSYDSNLGNDLEVGMGVAVDSTGNITVVGYNGDAKMFMIYYDTDGNQLWNATTEFAISPMAVAVDNNERSIVIASTSWNSDLNVMKYTMAGVHLWNATFDSGGSDIARSIAVDSSGNIIILGLKGIDDAHSQTLIVKYNAAGAKLWDLTYNYSNADHTDGYDIVTDAAQNIIVTGLTNAGGSQDYWTTLFNENGNNLNWTGTYNSGGNDVAYSVDVDSTGNFTVTGYWSAGESTGDTMTIKYMGANATEGRPETSQIVLNSTAGSYTNRTLNLTCWVNITDDVNTSLIAEYKWFNNSVEVTSLAGSAAVTAGQWAMVSNISYTNINISQNWTCSVRGWDGTRYGLWANASTIISPECGDTLAENKTHYLTRDAITSGTCFTAKKNVVLDCLGYAIRGDRTGAADTAVYSDTASTINNFTLKNCFIYNFTYGVYYQFSNSYFYNNTFTGVNYGPIYISAGTGNNISNNNFTSNAWGGTTYYAIYLGTSNNNVLNNYFYNTTGYDIDVASSATGQRIINNTIDANNRNKTTIYVSNGGMTYENNTILRQGTGSNSWALYTNQVNLAVYLIGNNSVGIGDTSVGTENLSDIYQVNRNNNIIDNVTRIKTNMFYHGNLAIYNSTNITVKNSFFGNNTNYAVNLHTVNNITFLNNTIRDGATNYAMTSTTVSNLYMENNSITSTGSCFYTASIANYTFINNTIAHTGTGYGLVLTTGSATDANLRMEGNYIRSSSGTGLYISNSNTLTNASIKNNIFADSGSQGLQFIGAGTYQNVSVYNNTFSSCGTGINTASSLINISFNTIRDCGTTSTKYGIYTTGKVNISNNTIYNCGIGIYLSAAGNNIWNNNLTNNTIWAIQILATSTPTYTRNNITHDNLINGYEPYYYYVPGQTVTIENLTLQIGRGVSTGVITVVDAINAVIRNNTIMSNESSASTGLAPGIGLANITNSRIEGNLINSTDYSIAVYTGYTSTPELVFNNNTIANNTFLNASNDMLYFLDGGINNTIINNTFKYLTASGKYGINTNKNADNLNDYNTITQNRFYNLTNAIYLNDIDYMDIEFNDITNITTKAIYIEDGATYITIHDNNITNIMTASAAAVGIYLTGSSTKNNSFTNNYFNNTGGYAIQWISNAANNSATNNKIYDAKTAALAINPASTAIQYAPQEIHNNTACYNAQAVTFGAGYDFNLTKTSNNTFCIKNVYPINGDTILATRFNITFNATNVYNTTNTNCTLFIDGANNYGYNQTTQNNKNTTIEMASAVSLGTHLLSINCTDVHDNKHLENSISFTADSSNVRPDTILIKVNSTYLTNSTSENITCWTNITDPENSSLIAYYNWYNNSVLYSSGTTAITANAITNISTIDSSLTTIGENWTCEAKGWDGELNETDWNNATINIRNSLPNIAQVFMNSSQGMNFTDEDLTCWATASDLENTSLVVYYNWYNRSVQMPELSGSAAVASGILTAVSALDHSYTFNDTWKCEVRAWDGTNNETDWNNATEINVSICGLVTRDFTLTENRDRNITSCLNITVNNTVLNCDNHLIKGNITKSGSNPTGDGGIGVKNGYNITIKYCNLTGFRYGVLLNKSNTIMFVNNSLINNSDGLFIDDSYGIDIIGNVINNQSRKGIITTKMNHTRIINNTIDYNYQYGIDTIDNIINITIENNSVSGTQTFDGIYLQLGRNITIANNILYNNDDYAIELVRINKINIANNIIDGNQNSINSINYYACNSTTVHNNTIVNNTNEGIYGTASPATNINTVITNNTILNNGQEGIQLDSSNDTAISGNIIRNNSYAGIYILSNNLSIYNNSISSNTDYGISVTGASNIFNISDNIINNNDYDGIYIQYAYVGNISHNRIFNNSQSGIQISNAANNKIWDNSIFNNTLEGIYFESSENLSIINNSINNNLDSGISSKLSNYANISGNNIANNTRFGIYFFLSNTSNVSFNSISFTSGTGILLNHTIYNRIFQNTVWNNTMHGIGIENGVSTSVACPEASCNDGTCIPTSWLCDGYSDCAGGEDEVGCGPMSWNKVINNTLYNNSAAGIVLFNTDNETVINNTVLSCGYYGILLNATVDSNVIGNTVKNNTYSIYLNGSSRNLIYNNYFENEPYADSASTDVNWNISKTLGTNIINGPYLGGNYWGDYNGTDNVDHDGLGDTEVPWTGVSEQIVNGGDYRPLLMRPDTLLVLVNSSFGTSYTNENVTCWANLTDPTNTSLVAYFNWYNNSVLYSSGSTAVALEILTNISTIDSSLTTIGENWTCEVKAWDGTDNETNWNNASLVIDNSLPNTTQIIVNSSFGTNYDTEDITCWANSTDAENTSLIINFNWYNNSVFYSSGRTAVTANVLTNVSTIDNSLTTVGENWTCEAKTWDGYNNETDWNNASVIILAVPVTATTGGGGGGGGATRVIYGGVNYSARCIESWMCTPMSECINGVKSRVCTDLNNCDSEKLKPAVSVACEVPKPVVKEMPFAEKVIVVPEIKREQPAAGPSLLSRMLDAASNAVISGIQGINKIIETAVSGIKDLGKIIVSGLITAKKGLIIAFTAVEVFVLEIPVWIMQNLCFVLMLAAYITLILAAVFSIIYFLTRNYFENMNKYFGISYILIALAGLFLMANFVACRDLLTPALLAIAGMVGVFVLDTIIAGIVRHGVDYWMKIKHRQSYERLGDKFQEIAEINRQLDRRWKKEFEKPVEIRISPPKESLLRAGLRKILGGISKFNYLLKRRIKSVQLPAFKKPEFRWPIFEPRVDYSGARELNKKIADIGRRIDSKIRETSVKPKIKEYPKLKVEKKKKDIFKPLGKSIERFREKIFKIEKSAGIGLGRIVKSGEKKLGKAVEFNARKAFVKVARTDESISELRKKIDGQLSDSWKNISQIKSGIEESRKKAVEESEQKKRQKELQEKRAVEEAEKKNRQRELEEKRAVTEKERLEAREQLRKDLEESLKKKKFNSLVAREKSMIAGLSSPDKTRIKEDADLGKTINSIDRFNGLLKKKIENIKPVVKKEPAQVLELSRKAEERINKRVSVDYQLALAQAMIEKRRRPPVSKDGPGIRAPKNDQEAKAVKKTVSRVGRFNELLKKKIDFVKRRKK